ncbi:hypothetical protein PR003_g9146 [Phytophthora rubi]|uniref:Uncharacterized protein n=1 Tax=Phytophthora rubi TaxID=129364 RepID=A0A6A3MB50_9STRA|nr:hypothetical protein PR002_g10151 [Phytophthora rubi]KAE9044628.1 hypothetical protein PR001_g5296 [Phytophthora rubi]KAE9343080.1 hypothetical protein PR003_g9146 [Phytophthora rubi]
MPYSLCESVAAVLRLAQLTLSDSYTPMNTPMLRQMLIVSHVPRIGHVAVHQK